jgi:hypothetical protein
MCQGIFNIKAEEILEASQIFVFDKILRMKNDDCEDLENYEIYEVFHDMEAAKIDISN